VHLCSPREQNFADEAGPGVKLRVARHPAVSQPLTLGYFRSILMAGEINVRLAETSRSYTRCWASGHRLSFTRKARRACARYMSMTSCTVWHCPDLPGALRMDMKQTPLPDASTGSSDRESLRALFVCPGHDAHGDTAPAGGERRLTHFGASAATAGIPSSRAGRHDSRAQLPHGGNSFQRILDGILDYCDSQKEAKCAMPGTRVESGWGFWFGQGAVRALLTADATPK
jgi:hypothetical protein